MEDLTFTKNSFLYSTDRTGAFRNYLSILVPEIVNMPDLGFSVELFDYLAFESSPRRDLIENSILNGSGQYNIVVKSYTSLYLAADGSLTIEDLILG